MYSSPEEFSARIINYINIAKDKPWKSWAVALPSHPLQFIDLTETQNKELATIVRSEAIRIMGDVFLQVSNWFQVHGFFEGEDHEVFNCAGHQNKLHKLMAVAEFKMTENQLGSTYFGNVIETDRNVLIFMEQLIADMQHACPQQMTCKKNCSYWEKKNLAFQIAKRMFCLEMGNLGKRFRFSFSRLYALIIASSGMLIDESQKISPIKWIEFTSVWDNLLKWEQTLGPNETLELGKRIPSDLDGKELVGEILCFVKFLERIKRPGCTKSSLTISRDLHPSCIEANDFSEGKLTITIKSDVLHDGGGADCSEFTGILARRGNPAIENKQDWVLEISAKNIVSSGQYKVTWEIK